MSDWNRGTDESNDPFDNLLAQLRQQNGISSPNAPGSSFLTQIAAPTDPYFVQPQQQRQVYHQQSVSTPNQTLPVYNQQPLHSSAVLGPASEILQPQQRQMAPISIGNSGTANSDRTANLLNLLKFSQPASSPSSQSTTLPLPQVSPPEQTFGSLPSNSRASSDLLATLMGTTPTVENKPVIQAALQSTGTSSDAASGPPANTQEFLLQLLNRPKPAQSEAKSGFDSSNSNSCAAAGPPAAVSDLAKSSENFSRRKSPEYQPDSHPSAQKPTQGLFTYINPFDQLAASSPRNRTPKPKASTPAPSGQGTPTMQILKHPRHGVADPSSDLKRKVNDSTPASSPAHSKRKLAASPSTSPPLPERSQIEALIGIGATGKGKETVAEAVRDVGNKVDKQVEEAIARAEEENDKTRVDVTQSQPIIDKDMQKMSKTTTEPEFDITSKVAAMSIKDQFGKKDSENILEDMMPSPVANAVKKMVEEAAHGNVADSWEIIAEGTVKENDELAIKVYDLPLKPWISITILPKVNPADLPQFRADGTMDVARFEKDFDQIDRTLVSPSNNFIVYSMLKGGMRVIAQQNGEDVKVFTEARDHIFNVSLSTSQSEPTETIIGTGISGTVYWATISSGKGDVYIRRGDKLKHTFSLPPIQSPGEESSGGMLKTRARKSCGHPEFFAVGRGKSIHIIWPSVITRQGYLKPGPARIVDTEKYLSHRSIKINIGKAGKDFTFSQDDTIIVSLDKAGRVKFWDVRTLKTADRGSDRYPVPEQIQPVEIKEPLLTLVTTPANEKSWPTSVLFVDKHRPYQKGGALRYLIVGMKQNHSLQLWDLGLGKPVQELHLPHEKESDAVCSVMYHPPTGMIVVGHPTRNSVYLIHLSSPKYNLPKGISQAEYTEKLVAKDPSLPKPDATAVMSGIREYSFANKGVLRSLDILANPASAATHLDDPSLFELYAMHSLGVSIITIKHADLGWNKENRIILPGVAEDEGLITVEPLKPITANEPDAVPASKSAILRGMPKDTPSREAGKKVISSNGHTDQTRTADAPTSTAPPPRVTVKPDPLQATPTNGGQESAASGTEKADKKKKKKAAATGRGSVEAVSTASTDAPPKVPSPPTTPKAGDSGQSSRQLLRKSNVEDGTSTNLATLTLAPEKSSDSVDGIVKNIFSEISSLFEGSFDELYRRFDDDRRTQADLADAKQDAMLRLISSTLSTNVEKTLGDIVMESIRKEILPKVSDVTAKAVHEQLGVKLGVHLKSSLPKELQSVLPDVLGKAMQRPEVIRQLSEAVAKSVAPRVEEQFTSLLKHSITPALTSVAVQAAQKASSDIHRQTTDVIMGLERQRHADSAKIEKLTMLVTGLSETVSTMAAAQSRFQGEFLKLQQTAHARLAEGEASNTGVERASTGSSRALVKTPEDEDIDTLIKEISSTLQDGKVGDAVMLWIQSGREQEVFEKFFSKYESSMIRGLSPLYLLSIGTQVAAAFDGNNMYLRLDWIETVLQSLMADITTMEDTARELIPKIVGGMVTQLEYLFMRVSSVDAQHVVLKRISQIVTLANRIIESSRTSFEGRRSSFGDNRTNFLSR